MKPTLALCALVALAATPALAADPCPVAAFDIPGAPKASATAARVGKTTVKVKEVDAKIAAELCKARVELAQKLSELRTQALDQLVAEKLLEAEAKKRKLDGVEALIKAEVVDPAPAPTEADTRAFYDKNQGQMRGASYEQVAPQISQHLLQQARQSRFDALVGGLRDAADVRVVLEPYRMTIPADNIAPGATKGPKDAPITVVEFADYECPYCARAADSFNVAAAKYPGKIRVIYRDFPLDFHPNAVPAAIAARCAGRQGKYFEMHDRLYQNQQALDPPALKTHAQAIGLDIAKYDACYADPAHLAGIAGDQTLGKTLGVEGTPAYFVNGIPMHGAQPAEAFIAIFEQELARKAKKK